MRRRNDGIADAFCLGEKNFFLARDAERERVDERILRVARLEADFAADGGHAEAVPVVADAADDTVENASILGGFFGRSRFARRDFTEAKRIENGDGPRAHGEDVAENSADAGGRALERFDIARMIVRFNLEGGDETIADVHDAGVFARTLHDEFSARGKALEMYFAGFVGAVLAPHHGENAEFGDVGIATENFLDARVLFGSDAVFGGDFGSDFNFGERGSH